MTSVGYGDISATTEYEAFFLFIGMFATAGTFAYTFNYVGVMVEEIQERNNYLKNQLTILQLYMHKMNVSKRLTQDVCKFLEHRIKQDSIMVSPQEELNILSRLNLSLQTKIKDEANSFMLKQMNQVFSIYSKQFQTEIQNLLGHQMFNEGENVFKNDTKEDSYIYMIQQGSVALGIRSEKYNHNFQELQIYNKNQYFGETEFYTNEQKQYRAIALQQTTLYMISRNQFLNLLKKSPLDYQKFRKIHDKLKFNTTNYNNTIQINHCVNCSKLGHTVFNCPQIHFMPDQEKIVLKHNFKNYKKNERDSNFQRTMKVKFNSRYDQECILEHQDALMDDIPSQILDQYEYDDDIDLEISQELENKGKQRLTLIRQQKAIFNQESESCNQILDELSSQLEQSSSESIQEVNQNKPKNKLPQKFEYNSLSPKVISQNQQSNKKNLSFKDHINEELEQSKNIQEIDEENKSLNNSTSQIEEQLKVKSICRGKLRQSGTNKQYNQNRKQSMNTSLHNNFNQTESQKNFNARPRHSILRQSFNKINVNNNNNSNLNNNNNQNNNNNSQNNNNNSQNINNNSQNNNQNFEDTGIRIQSVNRLSMVNQDYLNKLAQLRTNTTNLQTIITDNHEKQKNHSIIKNGTFSQHFIDLKFFDKITHLTHYFPEHNYNLLNTVRRLRISNMLFKKQCDGFGVYHFGWRRIYVEEHKIYKKTNWFKKHKMETNEIDYKKQFSKKQTRISIFQ